MKIKDYPLCSKMVEKGITDPDSRDGIDCCLNCELTICELEVGNKRRLPGGTIYVKKKRARELLKNGLSLNETAIQLGLSVRTIRRYLGK